MITSLSVKDFKAVPYLETSALMSKHKQKLKFSATKPNVIVGPNGSGKSALLNTLALRFLASFTGQSSFDDQYLLGREAEDCWSRDREWGNEYTWLKGLVCITDNAPVRYYRPGHIPGNEPNIAHAMMTGYFNEAKAYAKLVEDKSSGQQSQAVLASILAALRCEGPPAKYSHNNWRFGAAPKQLNTPAGGYHSYFDYQAEILKQRYTPATGAMPLILMDEPEQSLDARAEAMLWSQIAQADCTQVQIIVATHSLYPLMHKDRFNLIEAETDFSKDVLDLLA